MIRSLSLQGDPKLHSRIAVDTDELIVFKLNDIAALVSKERSNLCQLAWLVRKQNGYGEDTVSLDQSMLYHRRHGDDIHVTAA